MFQSSLTERYMRNVCFLACQALQGVTLGGAILSQCLSHADGCSLSLPLLVTLVKRFHMQKQVYFLFDSCSRFIFCFCFHTCYHCTYCLTAAPDFCATGKLMCEHMPEELTASCSLPAFVWGGRCGLCITFLHSDSSVCSALCPRAGCDTRLNW